MFFWLVFSTGKQPVCLAQIGFDTLDQSRYSPAPLGNPAGPRHRDHQGRGSVVTGRHLVLVDGIPETEQVVRAVFEPRGCSRPSIENGPQPKLPPQWIW